MIARLFASTFGLKGMAIAAGITLLAGVGLGWKGRDVLCDAAAVRLELEAERARTALLQKQIKVQSDIAAYAIEQHERLMQNSTDLERKVADYETKLSESKGAAACLIDDADLRFRDSLRQRSKGR